LASGEFCGINPAKITYLNPLLTALSDFGDCAGVRLLSGGTPVETAPKKVCRAIRKDKNG